MVSLILVLTITYRQHEQLRLVLDILPNTRVKAVGWVLAFIEILQIGLSFI